MIRPPQLIFCFIKLCYFGQWAVLAKPDTTSTTHGYLGHPALPPWPKWAEGITNHHLTNMSRLMMTDMKAKLEHTKSFLEKYKRSMTYELGTLASGVQTHFKHMLQVYKIHSNLKYFIREKYNRNILLDAYQVIQGDYNQIRYERTLFYQALDRHLEIRKQRSNDINKYSPGNPNHDEILKKLAAGHRYDPNSPDRRRSFSGTDQFDEQDDLQQPQHKTKAAVGGLTLETKPRKPKTKKLWKPQMSSFVKEFPVGD